jgi:Flp pilus assembly pilin Flp
VGYTLLVVFILLAVAVAVTALGGAVRDLFEAGVDSVPWHAHP